MAFNSVTSTSLDERLDPDGYLRDHTEWSQAIGQQLAARAQIELTKQHWRIIELLRAYYARTDTAPAMRPMVKFLRSELDSTLGSADLMRLFGDSPAKMAAKLAGLPRPTNCI
jgi:tRNA 2-thiouridine synthesizing protein E